MKSRRELNSSNEVKKPFLVLLGVSTKVNRCTETDTCPSPVRTEFAVVYFNFVRCNKYIAEEKRAYHTYRTLVASCRTSDSFPVSMERASDILQEMPFCRLQSATVR